MLPVTLAVLGTGVAIPFAVNFFAWRPFYRLARQVGVPGPLRKHMVAEAYRITRNMRRFAGGHGPQVSAHRFALMTLHNMIAEATGTLSEEDKFWLDFANRTLETSEVRS